MKLREKFIWIIPNIKIIVKNITIIVKNINPVNSVSAVPYQFGINIYD